MRWPPRPAPRRHRTARLSRRLRDHGGQVERGHRLSSGEYDQESVLQISFLQRYVADERYSWDAELDPRHRVAGQRAAGAAGRVPQQVADGFVTHGSAAECAARLAEYRAAGVDLPVLFPMPFRGDWGYEQTIAVLGRAAIRQ
jgi:alkanesulfonate monooxygenase SsuD/methylene tetrahydromethanopterin reductase-like flavin-dependent oxidoreductase (luciferase family)